MLVTTCIEEPIWMWNEMVTKLKFTCKNISIKKFNANLNYKISTKFCVILACVQCIVNTMNLYQESLVYERDFKPVAAGPGSRQQLQEQWSYTTSSSLWLSQQRPLPALTVSVFSRPGQKPGAGLQILILIHSFINSLTDGLWKYLYGAATP